MRKFAIGNEKGETILYGTSSGEIEGKLVSHENAVSFIDYDEYNGLLMTAGFDSHIYVHRRKKDGTFEVVRELRKNFNGK